MLNNISDEQWLQHFRELLTETRNEFLDEEEPTILDGNIQLTIEYVREAIKRTKLKKSPGPCGIYPELIKYGPSKLLEMFRSLFERCLNGDTIPKEWRESYTSPIHKKRFKKRSQEL